MSIPNNVLLPIILGKVKPNTVNLAQVHMPTQTITFKLNKKHPTDWGYPNVYTVTGTNSQIRNFVWLMKNNPNVIYIGSNRNVNEKLQHHNPLGKIVLSYL